MTKPADPNLQRPKAREPRTPKMVRESSTPINQSEDGGMVNGEGEKKSEPAAAETGAGPTFSGSREKGGGSDEAAPERAPRGQRKVLVQPVKEGEPVDGFRTFEKDGPPIEIEETPALASARRITRAGWRKVEPGEGDLGSGFYRFRAADIPHLPDRSRMAATIECFGVSLANARTHLRILVAQARGVSVAAVDVSEVSPSEFRPTRLCKRARRERGEA